MLHSWKILATTDLQLFTTWTPRPRGLQARSGSRDENDRTAAFGLVHFPSKRSWFSSRSMVCTDQKLVMVCLRIWGCKAKNMRRPTAEHHFHREQSVASLLDVSFFEEAKPRRNQTSHRGQWMSTSGLNHFSNSTSSGYSKGRSKKQKLPKENVRPHHRPQRKKSPEGPSKNAGLSMSTKSFGSSNKCMASSNKCHASSNKCLTSSNKKRT